MWKHILFYLFQLFHILHHHFDWGVYVRYFSIKHTLLLHNFHKQHYLLLITGTYTNTDYYMYYQTHQLTWQWFNGHANSRHTDHVWSTDPQTSRELHSYATQMLEGSVPITTRYRSYRNLHGITKQNSLGVFINKQIIPIWQLRFSPYVN